MYSNVETTSAAYNVKIRVWGCEFGLGLNFIESLLSAAVLPAGRPLSGNGKEGASPIDFLDIYGQQQPRSLCVRSFVRALVATKLHVFESLHSASRTYLPRTTYVQ